LRTVFAWSHDALPADAADLLTMLGVFPGETVSPESAAALTGGTPDRTEQILDTLAKAHLINHDTVRRYRFHDLVQRYAADRAERDLPADRRDLMCRRLVDWFLLSAANAAAVLALHHQRLPDLPEPVGIEPLTFNSDREAMRWCEAERSNLGAVTRWAVAHRWYRRGWQIPGAVYAVFNRYGPQDDLRELGELAVESARLDGHRVAEMGTVNNLATTYHFQHDYARAAATFEAALTIARDLGETMVEGICLHNLAVAHLALGRAAEAVRILEELLERWRERGDAIPESFTLHQLGDACRLMHRYDEAATHYREALAIRERIGSLREQAMTHSALATLFLETGQWDLALAHCGRALADHDHTKDDMTRCDALTTMADVQREMGTLRDSIRTARLAVALSEDVADTVRRCRALTVLAHALARAGHTSAAHRTSTDALAIVREVADPGTEALRDRLLAIRHDLVRAAG
jgi:tetratricopeptide (TPR) repeat protein